MSLPTLSKQDDTDMPRKGLKRLIPLLLIAVASSVTIGYAYVGWSIIYNQPDFSEHFDTQNDAQKTIALPDGSAIQLKGVATVSYTPKVRKVTLLSGQATFTIVESKVPFYIIAGKARMIADSGQFMVDNHRTDKAFEPVDIVSEKGSIQVMRDSVWMWQTKTLLEQGKAVQVDAEGNVGQVNNPTP